MTGRSLTILFITRTVPFPLDQGSRIRNYHLIKAVAETHSVILVTLAHSEKEAAAAEDLRSICNELHVIDVRRGFIRKLIQLAGSITSGQPYMTAANTSPAARDCIVKCLERRTVDIVQTEELFAAGNLPDHFEGTLILDAHNVEAQVAKRIAAAAPNFVTKIFHSIQARAIERFENQWAKRANALFVVSPDDQRFFSALNEVTVLVPNGSTPPVRPKERRNDTILFTGTLEYPPNAHGLTFFLESVLPLIRQRRPNAVLRVVARRPSPRHLRYAGNGVEFITSADDSAPFFREASVLVAPLFAGGGTRLKILEAFSSYLPVVSTTLGAEGLDATDGKHLLLADDAPGFAEAVIELLSNSEASERLSDAAASLVRAKYEWGRVTEPAIRCYESFHRERPHSKTIHS